MMKINVVLVFTFRYFYNVNSVFLIVLRFFENVAPDLRRFVGHGEFCCSLHGLCKQEINSKTFATVDCQLTTLFKHVVTLLLRLCKSPGMLRKPEVSRPRPETCKAKATDPRPRMQKEIVGKMPQLICQF